MSELVRLLPLRCESCANPLPAQSPEVAWVCPICGKAWLLDEGDGLAPLEIHYGGQVAPGKTGFPFWVVNARAAVTRSAYRGGRDGEQQAAAFWAAPRPLFIPAWNCALPTLLELGLRYLQAPPPVSAVQPQPFEPVIILPADLPGLAEMIVIALEAGRKDKLRSLNLSLQLSEAALWVLP